VVRSGTITQRKIGWISVRRGMDIPDAKFDLGRTMIARKLGEVKRALMVSNPVIGPKTPKAALSYYPMLLSGKGGTTKVQPGRLRRAIALGLTWGEVMSEQQTLHFAVGDIRVFNIKKLRGLRGLVQHETGVGRLGTTKITVVWGVGRNEFGAYWLPYGKYVANMRGVSTGGGERWQWDRQFRRWLAKRCKKIVGDVNRHPRLQLSGQNKFFWVSAPRL
jgi:hypothetical protein